MKYSVAVKLTTNGFSVLINQTPYYTEYPRKVWEVFPSLYKQKYAEFIAFMTTVRLAFSKNNQVKYLFPAPFAEPFFYYGLFLSQPENLFDFSNNNKTSDYLKIIFNSFFRTEFTGHQPLIPQKNDSYIPQKNTAILPFTFGKDSLITYAVCQEINIKTFPMFMLEKHKTYENNHRYQLIKQFVKEFKKTVLTFQVPLQELKQHSNFWWGWDIFLTQYTLFLVPFMHYYKPEYFFWSNEHDRNITGMDNEGFIVNPTFDQSGRWMQVLNTALQQFGCNVKLGSIEGSLTEIAAHWVLHHRYPQYAKYQTSCNNELLSSKTNRWCGSCASCVEAYLYIKALGFDPKQVSFSENLLTFHKRRFFHIFKDTGNQKIGLYKFPFFYNQHLYAFYLAYKNGIRGRLMEEFYRKYYLFVSKNALVFKKQYFTTYKTLTCPEELIVKIKNIYQKELDDINISYDH